MKNNKLTEAWAELSLSEETENRIYLKIQEKLRSQKKQSGFKLKHTLITAAVFISLIVTVAAASPLILKMLGSEIRFFDSGRQTRYSADQELIKQHSSEVGITEEKDGFSLTVDNIAFDGTFMNVFYTIKSEINLLEETAQFTQLKMSSERCAMFINEIQLEIPGYSLLNDAFRHWADDGYFVSEYELKAVSRYIITEDLPDVFDIEIKYHHFNNRPGLLSRNPTDPLMPIAVKLTVDMSETKAANLVVKPNLTAVVIQNDMNYADKIAHDITIDKVSISDLGNILVFTEKGRNDSVNLQVFENYFILDDKGNFYGNILNDGYYGNWNGHKTFMSEFFGSVPFDAQYLKLIPYNFEPIPEIISDPNGVKPGEEGFVGYEGLDPGEFYFESKANIGDLPDSLRQNEYGNVLIESCVVNDRNISVTYKYEGMVKAPFFAFADSKNNSISGLSFTPMPLYARSTDSYTVVFEINEPIEKAQRIKVIQYDIKLLEDQAIIIPLR